jgi:hypothetical protein
MKFFLDTEFIEGIRKPLFSRRRHFIDLISIGIVAENGKSYSAICSEYDYSKASRWVKSNVIIPLYQDTVHGDQRHIYNFYDFHLFFGKKKKQIVEEIKEFVYSQVNVQWKWNAINQKVPEKVFDPIDFYAYFGDYDWVAMCGLFGTMMDLPMGFPMYCRDLKQMLDETANNLSEKLVEEDAYFETKLLYLKEHALYPKQENEHNALDDAKWNYLLYCFIQEANKRLIGKTPAEDLLMDIYDVFTKYAHARETMETIFQMAHSDTMTIGEKMQQVLKIPVK